MTASSETQRPALYFYGHGVANPYGFLSQFWTVEFDAPSKTEEGAILQFWCAEQYMMYRKAILFEDYDIAKQIMAKLPKDKPTSVKALGRRVKGWDDEVWAKHRESIVEDGNWYKFTNSTKGGLKAKLLATGEQELVEVWSSVIRIGLSYILTVESQAAPRDAIWGIGFGASSAESNRTRWGLNLLGKALMRVRTRIREEQKAED